MNDRPCIRCHQSVVLDDGHLVYCTHCGAPQIFLSEELQAELAEGTRAYNERLSPPPAASGTHENTPDDAVPVARKRWNSLHLTKTSAAQTPWTVAVHFALLSAAVALALGLLSLLLPPLGFLMMLWVVSAPVVTVGLFQARAAAGARVGSDFGARLGLLTGLLVGSGSLVTFTLSLVLTRFVFHQAASLDAQLTTSFAQQRATVLARMGASVQPTLDMFNIPEYRVGLLLTVLAITGVIYLFLSTLSGGVVGLLLRSRRDA